MDLAAGAARAVPLVFELVTNGRETNRQAYDLPHDGSRMEEQRYPTYVRRVERVPYTVPEGRTVVIVD